MPSIVTINATDAEQSIDAGGQATLSFDVANTTTRRMSLRSRILTEGGGTVPAWLNLSEGDDLELDPSEAMRVSITATPPEGTNADLGVRLEVFEVDLPEENVDRSPPVRLRVTAPTSEPEPKPTRPRWLIPAIVGGVAVVALGGGATWLLTRGGLPDVTDMMQAEAEAVLTAIPVRNITYEMAEGSDARPGTVVEQFPRRGAANPEELTVELDLAGRPLPDFSEVELSVALQTMADLNLRLGDVFPTIGSGVPHGVVTKTNPPAGTQVTGGQIVNLTVALDEGSPVQSDIDPEDLQTLGALPFSISGDRPDCPSLFTDVDQPAGTLDRTGTPPCLMLERSFQLDGNRIVLNTF